MTRSNLILKLRGSVRRRESIVLFVIAMCAINLITLFIRYSQNPFTIAGLAVLMACAVPAALVVWMVIEDTRPFPETPKNPLENFPEHLEK